MGPLLLLTLLLIAAPASAEYFVEATGNVGFGETGSYQEGAFTEVDGPTSGSITVDQRYVDPVSGAVSSMYTTAEANLATGALRIYGTALGAEGQIITHAYFHDDVTFHLPEGMEISTIRGSLTIHGFEHGIFFSIEALL